MLLLPGATRAQHSDIYKSSAYIDSITAAGSTPYKYQLAATAYAFIGDSKKALALAGKQLNATADPGEIHKRVLSAYHPADATTYIIRRAARERIIIINERHYQPMHRAYMASLLPALKRAGFNKIAVEALDVADTLINTRRNALYTSGYYTKEAGFGRLLNNALDSGFKVYGYDDNAADWKQRERMQAVNIARLIGKEDKLIVICGMDHAMEDSLHMAGILHQLTGIDPFTIDQVQLSETGSPEKNNVYRKLMSTSYAAIYTDSAGNLFNKAHPGKPFDCNLYHPDTKYIQGRPAWLLTENTRLRYIKAALHYPCLVRIYEGTKQGDFSSKIPYDVIELNHAREKAVLLKKGIKTYQLVADGHMPMRVKL